MGFGFILAGLIFLFEPFINIFDILPDAIGYALIIYGLSKIADLELKAAEAKRRMTSAFAVALGKLATVALSFVMEFDATLLLVFSFSFATLEIFFVIPAFNMLFESLSYSCMRFSAKTINEKAENLQKVTPVFIVIRAVCAFAPQLTELVKHDPNSGTGTGLEGSAVIYIMLTVFCAVVAFVFGIVWISMAFPYIKSLKNNKELNLYFLDRYAAEVASHEVLHIKRSIKRFTALLFVSLFLFICVPIDEYYLMPEFFAPVLLLFGFYFAKKYTENFKQTCLLCVAATAVSLLAYILLFRYSANMGHIYWPHKAEGFFGYFAPYAVCSAAYHALFFFVYKRAFAAIRAMIGSSMGLRGTSDVRRREADDYRKAELCKKVNGLSAAVYVSLSVSAVMMLISPLFLLSWTVRLIAAVIAVVCAYNVKSDICEEAEKII
jgi:hypothetical protein